MKIRNVEPVYKPNKIKIFEEYYYNMPKIKYAIFCDLDGVLCDFNGRFEELIGSTPNDYEREHGTEKFIEAIQEHGTEFWAKMKWLAGGKELWNYIKRYAPVILSRPFKNDEDCIRGKIEWIYINLGKSVSFAMERNKEKYANSDSILIDDDAENIHKFKEAGGMTILYKNCDDAIKQLSAMISDRGYSF